MANMKGPYKKERLEELSFGSYLTELRISQRLTQKQVAEKINRSRSYICRIEIGKRDRKSVPRKPSESPKGFILYQLAEVYGKSPAEILEKAGWPQLLLLETTKKERRKLINYLNALRKH